MAELLAVLDRHVPVFWRQPLFQRSPDSCGKPANRPVAVAGFGPAWRPGSDFWRLLTISK